MPEVLVKKIDGRWMLWKDGQWAPAQPPVVQTLVPASAGDSSTDGIVRAALADIKLPDADLATQRRLENTVRLALKGVRSGVETREALTRQQAAGGLELTPVAADAIMDVIVRYVAKVHASAVPPLPVSSSQQEATQGGGQAMATTRPISAGATPASGVAAAQPPAAAPVQSTQARRPTMADVRQAPAALGPLDELRLMNLTDLRRLGSDAATAAMRLKNKFELFREESYETFAQGRRAWRESPLYQAYLSVGQAALDDGSSLTEAIARGKAKDNSSLSEGEWRAILNLNREIQG